MRIAALAAVAAAAWHWSSHPGFYSWPKWNLYLYVVLFRSFFLLSIQLYFFELLFGNNNDSRKLPAFVRHSNKLISEASETAEILSNAKQSKGRNYYKYCISISLGEAFFAYHKKPVIVRQGLHFCRAYFAFFIRFDPKYTFYKDPFQASRKRKKLVYISKKSEQPVTEQLRNVSQALGM